ncbi:hypothetical protein MIR68_012413 [Amoeboaphelidium protococcarum]|nr:hypothetical protein MIR68_012413 [Amoeboaphelidium protococcarum]
MTMQKKLKPIYDALDYEQYKSAINLCNKMLKKSAQDSSVPLIKTLKAMALCRLGTSQLVEAKSIADDVFQQLVNGAVDLEDDLLHTLVLVYKKLIDNDKIVQLYTLAVARHPKDEELLAHLFMAHTRNLDYSSMKACATKMHKQFKSSKYLFWSIFSTYLCGVYNEDALCKTLATRMLDKQYADGKLQNMEEYKFFTQLLIDNQSHDRALELLDKGNFKLTVEQFQLQLKALVGKQDQNALFQFCLVQLQLWPDDYELWFHLVQSCGSDRHMQEQCLQHIKQLMQTSNVRGPYLAFVEYAHEVDKSLFSEAFCQYYEKYGLKTCWFEDIKKYLNIISQMTSEDQRNLLKQLANDRQTRYTSVDDITWDVNICKLKCALGLLQLDNGLLQKYQDALELGKDLELTVNQFGDEFLLMYCQLLIKDKLSLQNVNGCISLLKHGLGKSKFNVQLKILLIRCLLYVGDFDEALSVYNSLDVKNILHDTVGWIIMPSAYFLGQLSKSQQLISNALTLYIENDGQVPEQVCQALKCEAYTKIVPFIEFHQKLASSVHKANLLITSAKLQLFQSFKSCSSVNEVANGFSQLQPLPDCTKLSDNRDLGVFDNFVGESSNYRQLISPSNDSAQSSLIPQCFLFKLVQSRLVSEDFAQCDSDYATFRCIKALVVDKDFVQFRNSIESLVKCVASVNNCSSEVLKSMVLCLEIVCFSLLIIESVDIGVLQKPDVKRVLSDAVNGCEQSLKLLIEGNVEGDVHSASFMDKNQPIDIQMYTAQLPDLQELMTLVTNLARLLKI